MYTLPFYQYTTSRFGETAGRANAHRGHDVAPGGQDFPSWVNGVVVTAGWQDCLGYRVVVQNDDDGYFIGVSHLANIKVGVGQRVNAPSAFGTGTPLGNIGDTGSCSAGRHAHITVSPSSRFPESGAVVDPVQYANSSAGGTGTAGLGYGLTVEAQLSLQRAMSHVGRYTGPHDGAFGTNSVKNMQQWLKDLGYLPTDYEVDGVPGDLYAKALQTLARDKGGYTGPIDGDPGSKTSEALIYWAEEVVIKSGGGSSDLYAFGLNMEAMRQIQAALTYSGHYTGPVDGVFGPASVAAFQQYLKDTGYLGADYGVDGNPGSLYGEAIQRLAQAKGGYTGAIDGVPGDQTSAALIVWAQWVMAGGITPPPPPPVDHARRWPLHGTFGIDVASPQRDIDANRAKADGAEFAIIKMGGLNVLPQYVAPYYHQLVDRFRAAGLKIGHYYLIGLGQTPEEQARYFVENLYDFRIDEDVLAIDNEKLDSNGTKWDDATVTRFIDEVVRLTGIPRHRIWHYAGAHDYRAMAPWPQLDADDVTFWWASYGDNAGARDHEPDLDRDLPAPAINPENRLVHQFGSLVEIAGYKLDGNWSSLELEELFRKGEVTAPVPDPEPDPDAPECPPDRTDQMIAELEGVIAMFR